jgi:hypothetical protein
MTFAKDAKSMIMTLDRVNSQGQVFHGAGIYDKQ